AQRAFTPSHPGSNRAPRSPASSTARLRHARVASGDPDVGYMADHARWMAGHPRPDRRLLWMTPRAVDGCTGSCQCSSDEKRPPTWPRSRVGGRCLDGCMPARPITVDDLPTPLPPLVLLVGDEDLLVDRAVTAVATAARRADPAVA